MARLTAYFVLFLGALGACSAVGAAPIEPGRGRDGEGRADVDVGRQGRPEPGRGLGQAGRDDDRDDRGRRPDEDRGRDADRGREDERGRGADRGRGNDNRGGRANAACDAARVQIIPLIRNTNTEVERLGAAGRNNATLIKVVTIIQGGLREAQGGVTDISAAVLRGVNPPQAGRDRVAKGLILARDGVLALHADDNDLRRRIARARASLNRTVTAGNQILRNCVDLEDDRNTATASRTLVLSSASASVTVSQTESVLSSAVSTIESVSGSASVTAAPSSSVASASGSAVTTLSSTSREVPSSSVASFTDSSAVPSETESVVSSSASVSDSTSVRGTATGSAVESRTTNPIGTAIDLPAITNSAAPPDAIPTRDAGVSSEAGVRTVTVTVTAAATELCPPAVTVTQTPSATTRGAASTVTGSSSSASAAATGRVLKLHRRQVLN